MNPKIYEYWGKTNSDKSEHYPVVYHCLDAAACGATFVEQNPRLKAMFDEIPLFNKNPGLLPFLIAVHDIGKFSIPFQKMIKSDSKNKYHHTVASIEFLTNSIKKALIQNLVTNSSGSDDDKESTTEILKILFEPVAGHHGKPVTESNYRLLQRNFGSKNVDDAEEFLNELIHMFLQNFESVYSDDDQVKKISWILAGICIVADWLASGKGHFTWKTEVIPLSEYYEISLKTAESVIKETGLKKLNISNLDTTEELFGFEPRPLQRKIEDLYVSSGPNLYIIEESTGSGKTEAALVLAHKLMKAGCGSGVYVALPTMATANSMYKRLCAEDADKKPIFKKLFAEYDSIGFALVHSNRNFLEEFRKVLSKYDEFNDDWRWIYDNKKKLLLAPVGVGTIDQILMSVLPKKHQSMILLGAVRNIVIIDEVHAYDSYMNKLLIKFLAYHKSTGGTVILLSATLPKKLKQEFVKVYSDSANVSDNAAYPMITSVNSKGKLSEIPVESSFYREDVSVCFAHDVDSVEKKIIDVAEKGGCVCWIRNTVKDAVNGYQSLKNRGLSVFLFHAKYTLGDRLEKERLVLEKFGKEKTDPYGKVISPSIEERKGQILIATQVVEQSLDLDFDFIVSDLAPIDLIIQRAGRLWRHKRDRPQGIDYPEMLIYAPELGYSLEDVHSDWYSNMFYGGSYVYKEPGKLWKTESILSKKLKLSVPSDARELIDYVYDDYGFVPPKLSEQDTKTDQANEKSKVIAQISSLELPKGYCIESSDYWLQPDTVQTRESEPSVILELWKSGELWYPNDDSNGMLSRVSIPYEYLNELVENQPNDGDVIRIDLVYDGMGDWIIYENQDGKVKYNSELGVIL